MIYFSELTSEMLSESGGCPEMILERQLRNISIDFLTQTELWQDRRVIPTVNGVGDYALNASDDESILKLTYCAVNDKELLQSVPQRTFPAHGTPHWYFLRDNSLNLRPFDQLKGDIEVEVVLIPNFRAVGIPEEVGARYAEALQKGALAKTLLMPGTPWYDPKAASIYMDLYSRATYEARRAGTRANHSRIRTTRFSW
jgi:hypothetical protein